MDPFSRTPLNPHDCFPDLSTKLVIVMVGLPARGKSFIVQKLARYLNWQQCQTRIFNAGELRRKTTPSQVENGSQSSAAFFDPKNENNVSKREEIALRVLDDLLNWIAQGGKSVGILDATNSTKERRQRVLQRIEQRFGTQLPVLFLESLCTDGAVLERNFQLKLSGPDYRSQEPRKALEDFKRRVALYEQAYVRMGSTEEDKGVSYVQVTDVGRKMTAHMIRGFLPSQVAEYMLGFNLTDRQLWISCGGESEDDVLGLIGRESNLSEHGTQYAEDLARFVSNRHFLWDTEAAKRGSKHPSSFSILTSTMPQTAQTADFFPKERYKVSQSKALDDVNAGDMAGMPFKEIAEKHPGVYATRKKHKLLYRWPGLGGEAYSDVIYRLRPTIVELERLEEHMLVISHRAVVRVLLAYFLDLQRDDLPDMAIPKDCAFLLEPKPYGIVFHAFQYDRERRIFNEIPNARARFL